MRKKGFTLVELLAVIAILAILVIIALPNVMGMFNTAKKNSFITECKNIYSSAQQSWMSDSVFGGKTQKYSKCKTCTDKKLDLSGRDNIDYYVEYDQSGSIVKFYVTDGTYQYRYDGRGLSKTDIRDVEVIADLPNGEGISISPSGLDTSKTVTIRTSMGSFSSTGTVREITADIIDDGYTYTYGRTGFAIADKNERDNIAILCVKMYFLNSNSYVRVYDSSNNLLVEVAGNKIPKERYSISRQYKLKDVDAIFELGMYDKEDLRIEASSDIVSLMESGTLDISIYQIMYTSETYNETINGPWVASNDPLVEKMETLMYSVNGYIIDGITFNNNTIDINWIPGGNVITR